MRYPKRQNKRALVLEDINHTNRYQLPLSRLPEHKSSPPPLYPPPHQGRFVVFHYGPPYSVSLIGCLRSRGTVDHRQKRPDGWSPTFWGGGGRLKEVLQQDRCMRGQSCAVFIWRESVTNYLCLRIGKVKVKC